MYFDLDRLSSPCEHHKQVEAEAELRGWQDFGVGPEFGATRKQPIIPGNSRARLCGDEEDRVTWLLSSAWLIPHFLKITNHNQHTFNIKYLANLIKKYWTCFRYQKLADFLVCFPPSVCVQVRWPPSWKICLRIQLSFGFWGRAVEAFDNFSRKLAWLLKTIFQKFWSRDLSPRFSKMEI